MVIDIKRFIEAGQGRWQELEAMLDSLERDAGRRLSVGEVKRLHYLYTRTAADMAAVSHMAAEEETRRYLESLVSRAYGEVHESRRRLRCVNPVRWLMIDFPRTFRRHMKAFNLSLAVTLGGAAFGLVAISVDPEAKAVIMPFGHLMGDPSERVEKEESVTEDRLEGQHFQGAAFYMTHNSRVSIGVMALGMTFGIGSLILLFYNGVILGAVVTDYVLAGESVFLAGWLLPHGAIEIPAILIAGQAGLVLGGALLGWGSRIRLRDRLRAVSGDLVTLVAGVVIMLIWAGIIEAFLSQYHEPVIPYGVKIGFGLVEWVLLVVFLTLSGRRSHHGEE